MIADILKGELEESNSESDGSSVGSETSSQRTRNYYQYSQKDNCLTGQICARCLSPILGPRRKSKICELCTAKMTFGISNGKPTETTFDKDCWRMLKKPVVFLPKTRNARTILTNEKRLWSSMTDNSTFSQNPPPNVFPFGDGAVNADVTVNKIHFSPPFANKSYSTLPVSVLPLYDEDPDEYKGEASSVFSYNK